MSSPGNRMHEQTQPLGDSFTLNKQSARGFVDRANRFRTDPEGAFLADRWCSGFFNVRSATGETAPAGDESLRSAPAREGLREADDGAFVMRFETVRGFFDRGGEFVPDREGDSLGDRCVSGWFNVRGTGTSIAPTQPD